MRMERQNIEMECMMVALGFRVEVCLRFSKIHSDTPSKDT